MFHRLIARLQTLTEQTFPASEFLAVFTAIEDFELDVLTFDTISFGQMDQFESV